MLLAAAIFINYADRGNLATAAPLLKGELKLSNAQIGLLTSAFFWVYAPAQLGVAWLVRRFDAYRALAFGLALWSAATFAIGQTLAGAGAAAKWIGVQNFVANLAGILAPLVTGALVDRTGDFRAAFLIAAAILAIGLGGWTLLIRRVEPIRWAEA